MNHALQTTGHVDKTLSSANYRGLVQRARNSSTCIRRTTIRCSKGGKNGQKSEKETEPSLALRSAWALAETGGNIRAKLFGGEAKQQSTSPSPQVQISRQDAVDAIREDYEVNYFVSGKGRLEAYDPDCRFADDFASFNGVERFRNNVSNLGGLTEDVRLETSAWEQNEDSLKVSWKFSAIVTIPWRPRLAASGATTYVFDESTGLVTDHIEEWNVEPKKVFQQLLRPASVPSDSSSAWERFMWPLSRGKAAEAWAVLSPTALVAGGAVLIFSLLLHATGADAVIPGWVSAPVGYGSLVVTLAAAGSELAKKTA